MVYLPLWKMMEWKSVGMMKFPTEWKNKIHVPNHQPMIIYPFFTGYSWGYTPFSAVPRPVQALFVDPTGWSQLLEAQHIQGLLKRPAAGDVALQCGKPWGLKTNGIKPRQIYIYTLYIYIYRYIHVYICIYICIVTLSLILYLEIIDVYYLVWICIMCVCIMLDTD